MTSYVFNSDNVAVTFKQRDISKAFLYFLFRFILKIGFIEA